MYPVDVLILCMNPLNAVRVVGPVVRKTSQLRMSARWLGIITFGRCWCLVWPTVQFGVIDAVTGRDSSDRRINKGRISLRLSRGKKSPSSLKMREAMCRALFDAKAHIET